MHPPGAAALHMPWMLQCSKIRWCQRQSPNMNRCCTTWLSLSCRHARSRPANALLHHALVAYNAAPASLPCTTNAKNSKTVMHHHDNPGWCANILQPNGSRAKIHSVWSTSSARAPYLLSYYCVKPCQQVVCRCVWVRTCSPTEPVAPLSLHVIMLQAVRRAYQYLHSTAVIRS
jgi:hypothetical protein